jgi:hypothetical protein
VTADYVPFTDVAEAALRGLTHYTISDEQVAAVMAGVGHLLVRFPGRAGVRGAAGDLGRGGVPVEAGRPATRPGSGKTQPARPRWKIEPWHLDP